MQVFILNFHGLGPLPSRLSDGEQECWLEQSFFEAILDLVRWRRDVQVTLDDSNESDYTIALPALKARNMQARFFVVAGRADQIGYLSSRHLQEISSSGMEIGSHGMRHRKWRGLNQDGLQEELVEAKGRLEQLLAKPVRGAACPFGSYDRHVLGALRSAGFERIYTSDGGPASENAVIQPRNTIRRTHTLEDVRKITNGRQNVVKKMLRGIKLKLKQLR